MSQIAHACPHCGGEPENYFEYPGTDDWTIVRPRAHPEGYACTRGCEQLSHGEWLFCCELCDGEIEATCDYAQPCDANGYVVAMRWRAAATEGATP